MSDGNIQMTNVAGPRVDIERAAPKLSRVVEAATTLQQRRRDRAKVDSNSLQVALAMEKHLRSVQSATTSVALGNALAAMRADFPDDDEFGGDMLAGNAASEIVNLVGELLGGQY